MCNDGMSGIDGSVITVCRKGDGESIAIGLVRQRGGGGGRQYRRRGLVVVGLYDITTVVI